MSPSASATAHEGATAEVQVVILRAQLVEAQSQLAEARRTLAANKFAGNAAHDFNNLLGIIIANIDLLAERLEADTESTKLANEALAAALRGAELAHRLLEMGRTHHVVDEKAEDESGLTGGKETVLAVDDNSGLLRVVVRQLKDLGYRVLEAEDGPSALMVLNNEPVDLLFTDVVMPGGMSGYDLARLVLARWPKMKALITSGFPELMPVGDSALQSKLKRLNKPYRKADLAEALREVLDA